ncbi:MAG: PfkB family carbohydrate kinase, partial [bacterium]
MYDLVSFGEVMLRLAAPGRQRLEQTASFDVHVGGTELNVAIGAGRLGLRTAYVTRLTDNALGRMIRNKVREQGVDASQIVWTEKDRIGLYFTESGTNPRGGDLIYDRADSAVSRIAPGEVDWENVFRAARHYHVTGITAALSPSAAAVTAESMAAAKAAGCTVSFDVNYRAKLWTESEARKCLEPLLKNVDILFTSGGEVKNVFGIAGRDAAETAAKIEE